MTAAPTSVHEINQRQNPEDIPMNPFEFPATYRSPRFERNVSTNLLIARGLTLLELPRNRRLYCSLASPSWDCRPAWLHCSTGRVLVAGYAR